MQPEPYLASFTQETKSLATHPLRKHLRECLASKKMKIKGKEKQSKALYILYIDQYLSVFYDGCMRIYIEKFFQPSQLRNLMVGGLQGEKWKFIQKYLKKRSKRVGAQISQFACRFRTLHGDLRKSRKLISQLGIHFCTLRSKFASCKNHFHMLDFNFARWSSKFARCEFVLQLDAVVLRRPYLPHFSSKSYMV